MVFVVPRREGIKEEGGEPGSPRSPRSPRARRDPLWPASGGRGRGRAPSRGRGRGRGRSRGAGRWNSVQPPELVATGVGPCFPLSCLIIYISSFRTFPA
jgi:hypothetical protein